jgi:putative ABC transport system permease protein
VSKLFGVPLGTLAVVLAVVLLGAVGVTVALALRNRIFFRLGVRNIRRRRGRSALIVVGLMLGTTLIAAALATGDTMSTTIRSGAFSALGPTDEVIAAKGIGSAISLGGEGTGARYFPEGYADRIAKAAAASHLIAGIEPVIDETIAVADARSRQSEPQVTLFASDPARMRGFGEMRSGGETVSLADLRPGEVFLNAKAADKLDARAGDTIGMLAGASVATAKVKAVVRYDGAGTSGAAVLMPLKPAQQLLHKPGLVKALFVDNTGGVGATGKVMRLLQPIVSPLGLEADNTRQDMIDAADKQGSAFMQLFTTFGSFSIAAGILLIFLIFVMLAAERRGELGIARAVGTRRRHLVSMFVFEGLAYDLLAALVGAALGLAVAYVMVRTIASAIGDTGNITIGYSVRPASIVVAYAIGVLLTLAVVIFSARRVSRMNIVAAIRDLPDPRAEKRGRRRWLRGAVGLALGLLIAVQGVSAKDAIVLGLGVSLVILSLVPLTRLVGVSDRAAHTGAGLALVIWFVLPINRWLLGELKTNFSVFILGGLMIVIGATWAIMYNADLLLGLLSASLGRIRRLAPVMRMSIAYPLQSIFRTGVTLAMFMLVVFTLVVGATITGSFVNAFNDLDSFGGGFDVRAQVAPAAPISNMAAAVRRGQGLHARDFRLVSSQSALPVKAVQVGSGVKPEDYLVRGVDATFLRHTTYRLAMTAHGYNSAAAVWNAIRTHPGLAVVDALSVPRKASYGFGAASTFGLTGFYIEDRTFAPVKVDVRDPQTGRHERLTVIGVLADSAPLYMMGITTSQATLARAFGDRVRPTSYLFALPDGVDATATAKRLETAFLANGMQADALSKLLHDTVAANLTFDRLIEGFMGLGLIVGVAALGVISARAVVERRQHIGVLRAIGFRRRMIQLSFLIESSFIALTAIVVGTFLGIAVAYNVITDAADAPGYENLSLQVPWLTLVGIFVAVYAVAMATTLAPARRASRVYPAQALRYQ